MARPPKYQPVYAEQAHKLCLLGATDAEMADFFRVDERTINRWKQDHPAFCQSIARGKLLADANVAERLYQRAMGYEHPEDKIFNDSGRPLIVPSIKCYPPDTQAASLWLRNRQPSKWRDRTEQAVDHGGTVGIVLEERIIDQAADAEDADG